MRGPVERASTLLFPEKTMHLVLASSTNANVVVVDAGKDGLSLILDTR